MSINFDRLFEVPSSDPNDARRRKMLNIMLAGVAVFGILFLIMTGLIHVLNPRVVMEEIAPGYLGAAIALIGTVVIYGINRYFSGPLASTLFLILWLVILPFIDDPAQVARGRALFIFTIPIFMASILLHPVTAFVFAGLGALIVTLIAVWLGEPPFLPAILGFFLVALISWVSASLREKTLNELRSVNEELDQRVFDRTQALTEVLDRERAEAMRNEAVLAGIADGVLVLDTNNRIMAANPAVERLTHQSLSDILGRRMETWVEQSLLSEQDQELLRRYLEEENPQHGRIRVRWGKFMLAIRAAPVHSGSGEQIGKVAVLHDFTREADAERLKSDFIAMVSHELRTPINSITGYMEMLYEGFYGELNDRQFGVIERVMVRTRRLLSIVNELLDQAQIEAGQMPVQSRPFRPAELLDHLHGAVESLAGEKGLQLIVHVSEELPETLYGDPQRLNQVLINLVHNAVKFTEQGTIQIRFFRYDSDRWAMAVEDTGEGIPADAQDLIFDPFHQADMEITRMHGGIGLGLSIVKRLVNLMQGEIRLSSQVGRGSTFTVILPFLPLTVLEKEIITNE